MTNDASRSAFLSAGHGSHTDWERTALQRVTAQHRELHDARAPNSHAVRGRDWEARAVECLRRYFRTHR